MQHISNRNIIVASQVVVDVRYLAMFSLNNLRTYALLIRYLIVCPPDSGSLETGI